MWNVCRAAALQQLKRSFTTTSSINPALVFASRNTAAITATIPRAGLVHHFTNVAGVDRDFILSRSPKELRVELGNAKIVRVQHALAKELTEMLASDDVSPDDVKDMFTAAQKIKATPVMLRAFEFMQNAFPNRVDFAMLGEVFRILMRARDGDKMLGIYEHLRARFQASTPEMVFRFGIVGKIELGDLDGANAIWEEMLAAGHATPNEVSSRMLQAHARAGHRERALEIYESLDPQIGQWHESAIDRVILSLGVLSEPQMAFDFYVNSSMKLNGGTLMALLSVCVSNNCHQQAADILANRKRFDLQLDARAYNRILTTLEFLGHHAEIVDVLTEMQANNTRFDTMTRAIIARNSDHLVGSSFADMASSANDARDNNDSNDNVGGPTTKRQSSYFAAPKIRAMLQQGDAPQAATLVDEFVKPLLATDMPDGVAFPAGALKVPAFLAKDAVSAYIQTGRHDKVAQLLQTFSALEGNYSHALAEIMVYYGKAGRDQNEALAYAATKALLFQGRPIFRVDDALALFRKFKDVDSTVTLFTQVIDEFAANKQQQQQLAASEASSDDGDDDASPATRPRDSAATRKRYSQFNLGRVINMTLQTLVTARELSQALDALDALDARGLQPTAFNYAVVFNTMREQNTAAARRLKAKSPTKNAKSARDLKPTVFDAAAFERVCDSMQRRDVRVNKSIVGNACAGLASGNKRQQLLLLEAYADAKRDAADKYVLPTACYATLLQVTAAQEGSIAEVQTMYEDAVASLAGSTQTGGRVPREWVTTLVTSLLAHNETDAAFAMCLDMQHQTGAFAYEALIAVLRAVATASDWSKATQVLELLETHAFRVNLTDAYDLVHVARDTNQPQLALEVVRLFEVAHVDPERDELRGGNLTDPRAAIKLRTMYRVTLNACEQNGQWKNALRLRERIAKLLGEDVAAEMQTSKASQQQQQQQ